MDVVHRIDEARDFDDVGVNDSNTREKERTKGQERETRDQGERERERERNKERKKRENDTCSVVGLLLLLGIFLHICLVDC